MFLLKGGHLKGKTICDIFISKNRSKFLKTKKLKLKIHMEQAVPYQVQSLRIIHVEKH